MDAPLWSWILRVYVCVCMYVCMYVCMPTTAWWSYSYFNRAHPHNVSQYVIHQILYIMWNFYLAIELLCQHRKWKCSLCNVHLHLDNGISLPVVYMYFLYTHPMLFMLLTSIMHWGMSSLLSLVVVLSAFLCRYSSSFQYPTLLSSLQNKRYSLCRLPAFAECGPHDPFKKSGGFMIKHGAHRHLLQ